MSLGAERWIGGAWLARATLYARRGSGLLVPKPENLPWFAELSPTPSIERSRGVELSARRLAGRVTGGVGVTVARARTTAAGESYAADEDRAVKLDGTVLAHLTRRLRLGAAYEWRAGRPMTPFRIYFLADSINPNPWESRVIDLRVGMPNSVRTAAQGRLDLLADLDGLLRSGRLGGFLQLRNVFGDASGVNRRYSLDSCPPLAPGQTCGRVNSFWEPTQEWVTFGVRYRF